MGGGCTLLDEHKRLTKDIFQPIKRHELSWGEGGYAQILWRLTADKAHPL